MASALFVLRWSFVTGMPVQAGLVSRAMQDSHDIVTTLDLTGLKCPLPVLKARRAVKAMADQGETGVIAVLADDPAAPLDFQHFCDTSGLALLRNDAEGGVFTLHIGVCADSLQGS